MSVLVESILPWYGGITNVGFSSVFFSRLNQMKKHLKISNMILHFYQYIKNYRHKYYKRAWSFPTFLDKKSEKNVKFQSPTK